MAGFTVTEAADGRSALALIDATDSDESSPSGLPDAVLLDIHLPDPNLDGFSVAAKLKQRAATRQKDIMIIALSGYEIGPDLQRENSFDHYLVKPAGLQQLLSLLRKPANAVG